MPENKFGLTRSIPEDVKRAVRQRDGFGCVMCGKAIYHYDHFDPEFAEARSHEATGITLLCSEHHGNAGKFLSRETIAAAIKSPKAKEKGFSHGAFDVGCDHPEIVIGTNVIQRAEQALTVDGVRVLSIEPPEGRGCPFRLNARIVGPDGIDRLWIVHNEWRTPSDLYDVTVIGRCITIRDTAGHIVLVLRTDPPRRLIVERLDMAQGDTVVSISEGGPIKMSNPRMKLEIGGNTISASNGIILNSSVISLG